MVEKIYKDSPLSTTIEKIRNILFKNGISVTEKLSEGFEGVFSVRLIIDGIGLGTNGKGSSKEIALASAYGELMERIQNFALYKFTFPTVIEASNARFHYAPDEIKIPFDQYSSYIHNFRDAINITKICIDDLKKLNPPYEREQDAFYCIPYMDYASDATVNLPAKLVEHIYASNGMSAGNTYAEALVQSISEIFERYSNKIIGGGKLVPPDLPIDRINFSQDMLNVLLKIKRKGNYEIIFKDCSLGMGLPVVGMYFIDKDTGKYFVKFGAHPILKIAAERTITELFQGRKFINSNLWLKSFTFAEIKNTEKNFEKIFRDGDGTYPYTIFESNFSYEPTESWFTDNSSDDLDNSVLLDFLFKIITKNNWHFLHRNVSFMRFPAVHAIIPEISFVNTIDENYVRKHSEFSNIKQNISTLNNCENDKLLGIINFINENYYASYDSILSLIILPLNETNIFSKTNSLYFRFLLYCKIKKYEEALACLDRFILDNNLSNSRNGTIIRCMREALYAIKIKNIGIQEAREILLSFYNESNVDIVLTMFCNENYIEEFHKLNCFNCNSCEYDCECRHPQIVKFHEKMAEKYLEWKVENND